MPKSGVPRPKGWPLRRGSGVESWLTNTNTRPVIGPACAAAGKEMENRAWAGAVAEAMRLRMRMPLRLRDTTRFPPHEVHQDELPQRHRIGEVRLATADRAYRLHELHQTAFA